MNKSMNNKKMIITSVLIIIGIWISYIHQMSPSPLLTFIKEDFGIYNNDALLNLSVSIIYPMIIIASLLGGLVEQRVGTRNLFIWTMFFVGIGVAVSFLSINFTIFLLGRSLYGIGFGLSIPFIGSAIMQWYTPKQQAVMNTINGLFPFLGNVAGLSLLVPMYYFFNKSWKVALGIWSVITVIVIIFWVTNTEQVEYDIENRQEEIKEDSLYKNLWKRKEIKILVITFACDFFCYSYIAIILPTYFMELGNMTETVAGLLAAIAFPAVGILGGIIGGISIAKTGRRRPTMAVGQILKTIGISMATMGAYTSILIVFIGVCIYGFGNSVWIPGMYTVSMELDEMSPTRVGGAFALITSGGFLFGFISPIIGGWLTNQLMAVSGIADPLANHVFGLQWSLFIFGFVNLIGFICILSLDETGPAVKNRITQEKISTEEL